MKKFIFFLLPLVVLGGCARAKPPAASQPQLQPSEYSVYDLQSYWKDQRNSDRRLGSLAGRVQLVALVYTHCADACPRILTSMKRIEAATRDVDFVLVSIDPLRDTAGQLQAFADGARLDAQRYTLLRGSDDAIAELAAALDVRYRKVDDGSFVHTAIITVLDKQGHVVYQQENADDTEHTIEILQQLKS